MDEEAPPLAADANMAVVKDEGNSSNWQNFPNGLRVLVVDDDPLCLKVIEQMLRRCNYEGDESCDVAYICLKRLFNDHCAVAVLTCATAAAALEQLRDKSHGFDLVLSDVYMPGA